MRGGGGGGRELLSFAVWCVGEEGVEKSFFVLFLFDCGFRSCCWFFSCAGCKVDRSRLVVMKKELRNCTPRFGSR